jgi:hypothetical protein
VDSAKRPPIDEAFAAVLLSSAVWVCCPSTKAMNGNSKAKYKRGADASTMCQIWKERPMSESNEKAPQQRTARRVYQLTPGEKARLREVAPNDGRDLALGVREAL